MGDETQPADLRRRLAALLYDAFLLTALLFIATVPATLLNQAAIEADGSIKHISFMIYLLLIWFLFYGWFWTHGGQTLGMTAWRIKIVTNSGSPLNWRTAFIRWCCACLGLANLSGFFNKERTGWHERLSATRTINVPLSAKRQS